MPGHARRRNFSPHGQRRLVAQGLEPRHPAPAR
ncbi:MAG: hypothetical protein IAE88_08640 [Rhodobacteraceae bacterium]|nr:hypothetical protein [Paracoccaceae bacterium]